MIASEVDIGDLTLRECAVRMQPSSQTPLAKARRRRTQASNRVTKFQERIELATEALDAAEHELALMLEDIASGQRSKTGDWAAES